MNLNKVLPAKNFTIRTAALAFGLIGLSVLVNTQLDIYGLFTSTKGKSLKIHNNERVSKYLLSYHYVPENFNTIVIGTSLSDNLEVSVYKDGKYKIYNASIMGANISEILPIAQNAIQGGIKNVVFCISPYLTKNSGSKEVEFGKKVYLGALGSVDLYQTYAIGLIRQTNLMPHKFPKGQFNESGVHFYADFFRLDDVQSKINDEIRLHANEEIPVDSIARQQFIDLVTLLKQNNVNCVGYFHPVPYEIYESNKANYKKFEQMISEISGDAIRLIDFNSIDNRAFTSDYTNYIDHGHLSEKGQRTLVDSLYKSLDVNKLN
jgi:hypothetical protein